MLCCDTDRPKDDPTQVVSHLISRGAWEAFCFSTKCLLSVLPALSAVKMLLGMALFSYIHSLVARTFFCTSRVHSHIRTSSCVCTYTHGSSVCKKVFAYVSLFSISPSPFSFLTNPCCSRTVTSRPLPTTTSLTIQSTRSCRTYLS